LRSEAKLKLTAEPAPVESVLLVIVSVVVAAPFGIDRDDHPVRPWSPNCDRLVEDASRTLQNELPRPCQADVPAMLPAVPLPPAACRR